MDRHWTFWTLTGWTNDASMRTFRSSGVHAQVMPKLAQWCNEAAVVQWEHAGIELPSWEEASERLRSLGRRSRVDAPTDDHEQGRIRLPRLTPLIERRLEPHIVPRHAAAARA
jgi:Domain of unknown function (DUF3291)